jgi:hypothetical protein
MLIPSYSRISAFPLIAWLFRSFYDPLQQRGEVPVAPEQRKLEAILAADVVGYSRLSWRKALTVRIRPAHAAHRPERNRSGCAAQWRPAHQCRRACLSLML